LRPLSRRTPSPLALVCLTAFSSVACAQEQPAPTAEITNGVVHAVVQLPDPAHGSYQGTRFDWSGILSSLEYAGHQYVGPWQDVHDPKIHDAVTGPAEEFLTNGSALGYTEAEPGGTFVRIGVGTIRKPAGEKEFQRFTTYEIVDHGKWTIHKKKDSVTFIHQLRSDDGYAYVYTKTVHLVRGKPELEIQHTLKNTGRKPIETSQYSHNFFTMDHQVVGPDVKVHFAFPAKAASEMKFGAQLKDGEITYERKLEGKQSAASDILGFGPTAKDYDIRIENHWAGTGVHITGDRPLEKLYFWSIRTVACPEPYIHLSIAPGSQTHWSSLYELYTFTGAKPATTASSASMPNTYN
jgi:hypothetical protein